VYHSRDLNIAIAIEHNHVVRRDLSFLNNLRDAVAYARGTEIKVCAEVQNFWVEYDLKHTIQSSIDVIDLVQISDWVMTDSAVPPSRAVLGDGDIPLETIMSWFLEAGYQGAFDIELVGPRIDQEGYQSAVSRSVDWLAAALDRLGA
jgi:sugar phosphate isomerase/epimerase